ncbi:MAG: carbon monoxide dehydrogenase subunit G [Armatimonadetes bacterium]|nr:carbon monoxide dehydrogenase subunit G [Armatimonadota bacterium]MDW8027640.1 carbon monoxide dehydrogenase subunit G [Armatimonadota bacterium]
MKLQGSWLFEGQREKVWQALIDPQVVAQCIPNCEKMEAQSDDTYIATLAVGIGSVKGRFTATIQLTDKEFPERYRLIVEAQSPVGFVKGDGFIALQPTDNGQTQVSIDGEVQVGGTIASVGSRLIQATANMMLNRFFEAMKKHIGQEEQKNLAQTEFAQPETEPITERVGDESNSEAQKS